MRLNVWAGNLDRRLYEQHLAWDRIADQLVAELS